MIDTPARPSRADVHRPSNIIPEDYEFVAQEYARVEDLGDAQFLMAERARILGHMVRTGGTYSGHEHGGNCGVCGSVNAIYTILFYHEKTNSYVRMGQDCATKCEVGNPDVFRAFRTQVQDALARRAGKAKAKAVLEEQGLGQAWAIYEAGVVEVTPFEERTISDIVGKLIAFGSISEKQTAFVAKLLEAIPNRAERDRQRALEDAAALPCPTGRLVIEGVILTTKEQASDFAPGGFTLKMLVKTDAGWKCWGTVPSILEVQRGDRVRFTATVTPSDRDPKFGFFKRPSKAEKL